MYNSNSQKQRALTKRFNVSFDKPLIFKTHTKKNSTAEEGKLYTVTFFREVKIFILNFDQFLMS